MAMAAVSCQLAQSESIADWDPCNFTKALPRITLQHRPGAAAMIETDKPERTASIKEERSSARLPPGEWNRRIGWLCTCLGAASGLIMGLWSFNGPFAVPGWLGEYDQVARRLARLGHIAFFGLGILNVLVAAELPRCSLGSATRRVASWAMNFGNVFLPLTLFAAAAYHPIKYFMSIPALAVFVALVLTACGAWRGRFPSQNGWPHDDHSP
jgi:hypothetical protein